MTLPHSLVARSTCMLPPQSSNLPSYRLHASLTLITLIPHDTLSNVRYFCSLRREIILKQKIMRAKDVTASQALRRHQPPLQLVHPTATRLFTRKSCELQADNRSMPGRFKGRTAEIRDSLLFRIRSHICFLLRSLILKINIIT